MKRLERTVLNWRWWAVLPVLFGILLPLALISMVAEATSDVIARISQTLMRWSRTE